MNQIFLETRMFWLWDGEEIMTLAILRNRLPVGGVCVYVLQLFFFCFFCFLFFFVFFCFFPFHQNYETTVLGNG